MRSLRGLRLHLPHENFPLRGLEGGGGLGKVHPVRSLRGGLPPEGAEAGAEVGKREEGLMAATTKIVLSSGVSMRGSVGLCGYVLDLAAMET